LSVRGRAGLPSAGAATYAEARAAGNFDTAAVIAGEGVDLIRDIPPAAEVVERTVGEAEILLARAADRL
jgi:nitronate monooxygenase